MDTVTQLRMAVGLLTRPSKHRLVDRETGVARWVEADPLLVQLRTEVRNSSAGATFRASNGNPLPIGADAFDLECRIRLVIAERWWALYRLHHGHGKEDFMAKLRAWAAVAQADEVLTAEAERYCTGWVKAIQSLLQPVRRVEIRAACPVCKVERVIDHYDEEGGKVTRSALAIEYSNEGIPGPAVCAHCRTEWTNHALLGLELKGAEA